MNALLQVIRMALRDWRAGELRLLVASLVIAVAAVTSVSFFVDRMQAGLDRDAAQLLGGDLVVTADHPLSATFEAEAVRVGLRVAQSAQFPSMAVHPVAPGQVGEPQAQLVALKAVGAGYPLRGALRVAPQVLVADTAVAGIPPAGTVWIDPQLVATLAVSVGGDLKLGDRRFVVDRLVTAEPDRGAGFINFAPRVLMRLDDLVSTGLIQPGARVSYRMLVAGEVKAVRQFRRWLDEHAERGQRIESVVSNAGDRSRPDLNQTLNRARTFLSLAAMLTVILAAVAVALASRRYVVRHLDGCAVMRCLGATSTRMMTMFATEFALVGLAASAAGAALGFAAHFVLTTGLARMVGVDLPQASSMPIVQGVVTGFLLLVGFAMPPLLQLRHVPAVRVLRRELGVMTTPVALSYGAGLAALLALLLWFSGDLNLGLIAGFGFLGAFVLFAGAAFLVLRAMSPMRIWFARVSVVLHFAFAGVARRPNATVVQVVALAIGLMSLLLLAMTRTDLVDGWRTAAPADAPNRFVINIQPDQRERFNDLLVQNGLARQTLLPMVRGRLIEVNGKPVSADDYTGRARRLVDREFNLSYMAEAPAYNEIVEGRWFAPDADEISVERGLMDDLGLKLGDRLAFDVGGAVVQARIGSVRKVEWNSFKVNFFVIFPPRLLEPHQQTFITSFRMPDGRDIGPKLSIELPNLTIIDTGAVLHQVQTMLDQVIGAVEFLFAFAVLAGALVLYAAMAATRDERVREAGILRALGATRRQLWRAQLAEFMFIGGVSGILAALGATAVGWALARFAFDFTLRPNPWFIAAGVVMACAISCASAWVGLRGVLVRPPLRTLRDT